MAPTRKYGALPSYGGAGTMGSLFDSRENIGASYTCPHTIRSTSLWTSRDT